MQHHLSEVMEGLLWGGIIVLLFSAFLMFATGSDEVLWDMIKEII